ncbi:MAG: lipopolysaccharide assembly protein LapA domain-containing protein [Rudaea sp.]
MRFALVLLVLAFAAAGALFGALNGERVALDFYFAQAQFPKGAALLFALLIGWLLGGLLVYFSIVPGLRRRVRAQTKELNRINRERATASAAVDAESREIAQPREA